MKIAVTTCAYNERFLLERWLAYYSKIADSIHVVDHETQDGSIEKAMKKFKFSYHAMSGPHWDVSTGGLTTEKNKELVRNLLGDYDCIVCPDVDEFIIPDPEKYKNLRDYIGRMKTAYSRCDGHALVETIGEPPIDWDKPLLEQRKYWRWEEQLCKPIVTKIPLDWSAGKHALISGEMLKPDKDLVLIHLKEMDSQQIRGNRIMALPHSENLAIVPTKWKGVKI